MKVLILGKFSLNYQGGIERVSRDWFTYLSNVNCVNDVFYLSNLESSGALKPTSSESGSYVNFFVGTQPVSFDYIKTYIREMNNFDVVHVHFPNIISAILICLFRPEGKVIIHWHSDLLGKSRFLQVFGNIFLKRACLVADRIVATSKDYAESSLILRDFQTKVSIAPITIRGPAKHYIESYSEPKFILAIGRLVSYKGYENLIKSMPYVNESVSLTIVGEGPLRLDLEKLVLELDLVNRVQIVGSVSSDELKSLLKSCFALVLNSNSRAEAFGVVLIEALSFGKPLLTSHVSGSGMNFVNLDGVTGFHHDSDNLQSLGRNLDRLLADESNRALIVNQCFKRYQDFFSEVNLDYYISNIFDLNRKNVGNI